MERNEIWKILNVNILITLQSTMEIVGLSFRVAHTIALSRKTDTNIDLLLLQHLPMPQFQNRNFGTKMNQMLKRNCEPDLNTNRVIFDPIAFLLLQNLESAHNTYTSGDYNRKDDSNSTARRGSSRKMRRRMMPKN
ncbi:hypothetical protein BLNAU_8802 [Blattamonas nauphoetae]|uniref:Uncharacterized protein n=1 Tax=Blattamonas nauphoetae TaxID=2049346 RepID=A0ABQ9XXL7_9EUKA|nr:hypothetical protein BLNAU_8802 [Blattamonas nauphoetae]